MKSVRSLVLVGVGAVVIGGAAAVGSALASRGASKPNSHHDDAGLLNSMVYVEPFKSFDDLVMQSTAIALVAVEARLEDYWVPRDPEISVMAQFRVRVVRSLQGDLRSGDTFVVRVPGGEILEVGNPQPGGSFRPKRGEKTITLEYGDFPFYKRGTQELVFFTSAASTDDGERMLLTAGPTRYRVGASGKLESVVDGDPTTADGFPSGHPARLVVGSTLDEVAARVAGAKVP